LIELADVSFSYTSHENSILSGISLKIDDGEWIEISGGNSSGKTTLCKIMSGLLKPHSGVVLIDGQQPDRALENFKEPPPISMTFQNPDNYFVTSSVKDELLFTMKNLSLPEEIIKKRFDEAIELFRLSECLNRNPHRLSGGEKQRLSLAIAWSTGAKHLILDEPLSFLDKEGREDFLSTLKMAFEGAGISIVWITLFTGEFRYATRRLIIGNGSLTELNGGSADYDGKPLDALNRELSSGAAFHLPGASTVLEISGAVFGYSDSGFAIEVDDLSIKEGELLLVTGENGSGKTTFLLGASGLLNPVSGKVKIFNRSIESKKDFPHGKVGFIFQAPEDTFFKSTVLEEIAFGLASTTRETIAVDVVSGALNLVGLNPEIYLSKSPYSLSQSEKRLVAIASTIVVDPDIYFFDEPFIFLDVNAMARVLRLIVDLNRKGKTIVVATHASELLQGLATRSLYCKDRRCILRDKNS